MIRTNLQSNAYTVLCISTMTQCMHSQQDHKDNALWKQLSLCGAAGNIPLCCQWQSQGSRLRPGPAALAVCDLPLLL